MSLPYMLIRKSLKYNLCSPNIAQYLVLTFNDWFVQFVTYNVNKKCWYINGEQIICQQEISLYHYCCKRYTYETLLNWKSCYYWLVQMTLLNPTWTVRPWIDYRICNSPVWLLILLIFIWGVIFYVKKVFCFVIFSTLL